MSAEAAGSVRHELVKIVVSEVLIEPIILEAVIILCGHHSMLDDLQGLLLWLRNQVVCLLHSHALSCHLLQLCWQPSQKPAQGMLQLAGC